MYRSLQKAPKNREISANFRSSPREHYSSETLRRSRHKDCAGRFQVRKNPKDRFEEGAR